MILTVSEVLVDLLARSIELALFMEMIRKDVPDGDPVELVSIGE